MRRDGRRRDRRRARRARLGCCFAGRIALGLWGRRAGDRLAGASGTHPAGDRRDVATQPDVARGSRRGGPSPEGGGRFLRSAPPAPRRRRAPAAG